MTRKEYTPEILRQTAAELSAVMEKVIKNGLNKVAQHGYFDNQRNKIEKPNPQHWGPRLKTLAESDVARDLACTSAALNGGYDPIMVASVFSDGDDGKTRFLGQLLSGARAVHEKTGKGVNFPFFPFFDRRKGESLVNALSDEECKLLGVGEFEPAHSPASGSLEVLLKHFEDRGSGGRTPVQVFCSYFSREEKEPEKPVVAGKVATPPAPSVNDLDLDEPAAPAVGAKAKLEEIGAPPTAPVAAAPVPVPVPPVPTVINLDDDLDTPALGVSAVVPATPKVSAVGNGKSNGGAEAAEFADLLAATEKSVAVALARQLRQGKVTMDAAQTRARKFGLI